MLRASRAHTRLGVLQEISPDLQAVLAEVLLFLGVVERVEQNAQVICQLRVVFEQLVVLPVLTGLHHFTESTVEHPGSVG